MLLLQVVPVVVPVDSGPMPPGVGEFFAALWITLMFGSIVFWRVGRARHDDREDPHGFGMWAAVKEFALVTMCFTWGVSALALIAFVVREVIW